MPYISPLEPWLNRSRPLMSFADLSNFNPKQELGGYLAFDSVIPIHEAVNLKGQSLLDSWEKTDEYVKSSLGLIDSSVGGWLDHEEVQIILENLGNPPLGCYPIYMITVGSGNNEIVVYFGKTSSRKNRFLQGHPVLTKLHAPKFEGMQKQLYQGCVMLLTEKDYLPLEWVHPYPIAERILLSAEAQLIYHFDPEFNTFSKNKYNAKMPMVINIENHTGKSKYLNQISVPRN